jgi:hypothetical protein
MNLLITLVLLLFLFKGEPDLFDHLHEAAMAATDVKGYCK